MNEIEKQLADEKKRLEEIKAPEELMGRLRQTLEQTKPARRKKKFPQWGIAIAAVLLFSIVSYNYNAFAYYGKKMLGYDELMTGTLAQLNEEGNGQEIGKEVRLSDGTILYLDGMVTDENQFILYYTLSNPNGLDGSSYFSKITGFLTHSNPSSGTFEMNEEGTKRKGIQSFDAVSPFAKKLTLEYFTDENNESGEITFSYDPKQAMQTELKQSIGKKVQVDTGTIQFDTVIATPSRTTIKGKLNGKDFDRIALGFFGVQLLANGKQIELTGSSSRSGIVGQTFEIYYDRLPTEVDTLEVVVDTFVGYKKVNESIALNGDSKQVTSVDGKELLISTLEKTADGIQLTIATEQDLLLDGVSIETNGKIAPLETTLRADLVDRENGEPYKQRILLFKTDELPDSLVIDGVYYAKEYGKRIQLIGGK